MNLRLGIALGDVTGIGPEVTLKALAAEAGRDSSKYLLIGDERQLRRAIEKSRLSIPLARFDADDHSTPFQVVNPPGPALPETMSAGDPRAAHAAVAALKLAGELCLRNELAGMVTAPVNKEAIIRAGHPFVGQTEFLSQLAGTSRTAMMLLGHDDRERWLRVVLATVHLAIRDVPQALTVDKVLSAIERAAEACRLLALTRARVAVCGLNPHCGEGGAFGDEEKHVIETAILAAKRKNLEVIGPLSGDTVFHHAMLGEFDVVVAMYHDQGLAPLKTVAFDTGVNWTLGLPFIRTSPDHGTAYDIAGKGIANPSSMIAAIRLARKLGRVDSRPA
jgi:4-hydroxythreonine-4-phosphate dehydrogenase